MNDLESKVERYLIRRVKELHGKAYKFISPGNSGVPDRLAVIPDPQIGEARIWFVEVKRPGEAPRPQQRLKLRELKRLGARCEVVDSKEAVNQFMYKVRRELRHDDF